MSEDIVYKMPPTKQHKNENPFEDIKDAPAFLDWYHDVTSVKSFLFLC